MEKKEDLISRQAAIKLAIDLDCESRGIIKESKCREIEDRYNMIPAAQLAQDLHNSCTDTISRDAALDAIRKYDFFFPQYVERFVTELRDAMKSDLVNDIKNLPSAQPQRRKGNWVCIDGINYECDQCGCVLEDWIQGAFYNYCPNCGARMYGGDTE